MAEKEYIERKEAIEKIESLSVTVTGLQAGKGVLAEFEKQYKDSVRRILSDAPAADVVGRSAYDQTKWERDIAMQQLADAGIPFGAKVEVVHAKWIPHEHMSRTPYARNYDCSACGNSPIETGDFCNKCGAKMDGGANHGDA